jgi:hypothetical protein
MYFYEGWTLLDWLMRGPNETRCYEWDGPYRERRLTAAAAYLRRFLPRPECRKMQHATSPRACTYGQNMDVRGQYWVA